MKRPSKKDIKAAIDGLKNTSNEGGANPDKNTGGSLSEKKTSQRIRKQGV
ncbi:MAG: hypothetical protein ACO1SV_18610 [Fimbriimonas sp.]